MAPELVPFLRSLHTQEIAVAETAIEKTSVVDTAIEDPVMVEPAIEKPTAVEPAVTDPIEAAVEEPVASEPAPAALPNIVLLPSPHTQENDTEEPTLPVPHPVSPIYHYHT